VLTKLGVKHYFLVVGGNAMHLDDAIRLSNIPYTAFHNEQAAAMAAESYARLKGEIAVCVVTSGPGVSNLATGVAGAFLDSAPVLYISGQAKSLEMVTEDMKPGVRQVGTFELPGVKILGGITKSTRILQLQENVQEVISNLVETALQGRPGPVYLEVPVDVQGASCIQAHETLAISRSSSLDGKSISFANAFFEALKISKKPLILAGHGVRTGRGRDSLLKLINELNIPLVTTQLAKDLIPYSDPHFVGHPGLRGDRAGNLAVFESDLLLCIGTSLQQQTVGYEPADFAPNSKKFVVDFEQSVSKKNVPFAIERVVNCEVSTVLQDLLRSSSSHSGQLNDFDPWIKLNADRKHDLAVSKEPHDLSTPEINMYEFASVLSEASFPGDTILTDAGLCFYIIGQAYLTKEGQRYIASGGLGSMGYALPASIGAVAAGSERVICITGDGSAQMNVQEFATLASIKGRAIIFVINNGGYASIRNTQRSFFSPSLIGASESSGVLMPDWAKIADAYGLNFMRIESRSGLKNGIDNALSSKAPILVEVISQYTQGLMPSVSSFKQDDGRLKSNPLHIMSPSLATAENPVELN
jgi:acetolactate synthase-1/2/3 large subunit